MASLSDTAESVFDENPGTIDRMPARPHRILHADLPFYSDPGCTKKVENATLLILRCEDPAQTHQMIECMPTRKRYQAGQIVTWELNKDQIWEDAWYRNPETEKVEKAWTQAVEFEGRIVAHAG